MARYLVTGGAGFIGSGLVRELVSRGEEVRVLDNFCTGKRENLEPFSGKIEVLEGERGRLPDWWKGPWRVSNTSCTRPPSRPSSARWNPRWGPTPPT